MFSPPSHELLLNLPGYNIFASSMQKNGVKTSFTYKSMKLCHLNSRPTCNLLFHDVFISNRNILAEQLHDDDFKATVERLKRNLSIGLKGKGYN
jgi:hypothetical protein